MLQLQNNEINTYQLQTINKWSLDNISKFKSMYNQKVSQNSIEAKECLNTIYEYSLSFEQSSELNNDKLHKLGIKNISEKVSKNRKIEELIKTHNELVKQKELENYSNKNDEEIIKRVNKIKNLYKTYLQNEITKENISEKIKTSDDDLISIAMSVINNKKQIILRDSQIYALILLLSKNKQKGKIIQIMSGEGKTIITFCLSIILVLKGHKVDIVCKSSKQAEKDAKEAEIILEKLKISVGNINDDLDCYKRDILYGTVTEFLGGIMNDEYYLQGIRKERNFDILIVDEIDSMFLDDSSKSTGLVSPQPFLEQNSIYLLILWAYYKNLHLNKFDVNKNVDLRINLRQYLNEKIKNFIKINTSNSDFFIPTHSLLKDDAIDKSEKWVNNLISSLSQRKNVEYTINNGNIVPVDVGDTGVIQNEKIFEGGLQQFLQIDNNLSVSPISSNSTSTTLSHYGFFQKYRIKEEKNDKENNIYGTTSVIGAKKSRELLEQIYGIDFDYLPTNNSYLLKELTSNISLNHDSWIENILRITKREINSGRGVLILCETVEHCEEIYDKIKIKFPKYKLIKIIGEKIEKNLSNTLLEQNTVVLSTDISGNGINFNISESILKNGGMHIIFSFLLSNSRKEEKNFKKIGEAGNPGTYQLVLDYEETMNIFYYNYDIEYRYKEYNDLLKNENKDKEITEKLDKFSIKEIKNLRETRNNDKCNNILKKIENINKEDFLFNIYCKMLKERNELKDPENKDCLNSIDERWGMFQNKFDVENKTIEQMEKECGNFKKMIFEDLDKGKVVKNPGYYNQYVDEKLKFVYNNIKGRNILLEMKSDNFQTAKDIFVKKEEEKFEFNKYIQKCNSSIELNIYSFIPYYLKGINKIMNGENGIEDLKKSLFYIDEEIKRYLNLFGIFTSLDINIDLIYHHINILSNIQDNLIKKNIEYYNNHLNNNNDNNFALYSKIFSECFYPEEKEEKGKEREENNFLKTLKKYYSNTENSGLKYVFSLEKISTWKLNSLIIRGIIMIGLSITGFKDLKNLLTENVFKNIENIVGFNLSYKNYED